MTSSNWPHLNQSQTVSKTMASKDYITPTHKKPRFKNLSGRKYGRWTVVKFSHRTTSGYLWHVECECGEKAVRLIGNLSRGKSKSCGCWRDDKITTHGKSHSTEHMAWNAMIRRCTRKTSKDYDRYGGRGITVCKRWLKSFDNFLKDMGYRPKDKHSIDRINNNKGYSPKNCRWATHSEQNRNRRHSVILTLNGETKHVHEWADQYKIRAWTITRRIKKGWSVEDAITLPLYESLRKRK